MHICRKALLWPPASRCHTSINTEILVLHTILLTVCSTRNCLHMGITCKFCIRLTTVAMDAWSRVMCCLCKASSNRRSVKHELCITIID